MSIIDRIRDEMRHLRREFGADVPDSEIGIELRLPEAEALLALADAAHRCVNDDCLHADLEDAVARLDESDHNRGANDDPP